MALVKELESSYGVKPSYHRILNISLNAVDKEIIICVGSYLSKEAREKGYEAIDTIDILVPKVDYEPFLIGDIFKNSYKWLRENVLNMEDAIDD